MRRELDALNAGLDGAFSRLRALETVLENQIAALDEAGARVEVRGEAVAARLTPSANASNRSPDRSANSAARAAETVAGRTAQLKASIESRRRCAQKRGTTLETQAASFRAAASAAADAPHAAAVELDRQAKRIESVADAAMARAEFVLGRQERHRGAMNELMQRLKDESATSKRRSSKERSSIEQAIQALGGEAQKFEHVTGDAERHLELIMSNASARASQLTANFMREAEKLKEASDAANTTLANMINALHEANAGAQTLIGETASEAKINARALVGEAMAECERLLAHVGRTVGRSHGDPHDARQVGRRSAAAPADPARHRAAGSAPRARHGARGDRGNPRSLGANAFHHSRAQRRRVCRRARPPSRRRPNSPRAKACSAWPSA